jgi:hypothetical protein
VPDWLLRLLAAEAQATEADIRSIQGRFQGAGVTELIARGDPNRPDGIEYRRPSDEGWVDVRWALGNAPVTSALVDLAESIGTFDQLSRLHSAMMDLDIIRDAARELARYRHPVGGDEEPLHNPHWLLHKVAEVGIVVLYARAFTGRARLSETWLPEGAADREVHKRILRLRQEVYAHADFTPERGLVDINSMLGQSGPPIFSERRSQMSREQLEALASLADRQHARFWIETARLKRELGSPATG